MHNRFVHRTYVPDHLQPDYEEWDLEKPEYNIAKHYVNPPLINSLETNVDTQNNQMSI